MARVLSWIAPTAWAALLAVACGDGGDDAPCQPGTLGCECLGGDTCSGALACISELCVGGDMAEDSDTRARADGVTGQDAVGDGDGDGGVASDALARDAGTTDGGATPADSGTPDDQDAQAMNDDAGMLSTAGDAMTADAGTTCDPACAADQLCNATTGSCDPVLASSCPDGCGDDELCENDICVPAPAEGTADAQCVIDAMALDSTATADCATCLCTSGTGCLAELAACTSDGAPCTDLVACSATNGCTSACCLCDPASAPASGAPCGSLGENLNTGVCTDEVAVSVGLSAGGINVFNATMVVDQCAPGGGTPCAHEAELDACLAEKCSAVCTPPPMCVTN